MGRAVGSLDDLVDPCPLRRIDLAEDTALVAEDPQKGSGIVWVDPVRTPAAGGLCGLVELEPRSRTSCALHPPVHEGRQRQPKRIESTDLAFLVSERLHEGSFAAGDSLRPRDHLAQPSATPICHGLEGPVPAQPSTEPEVCEGAAGQTSRRCPSVWTCACRRW